VDDYVYAYVRQAPSKSKVRIGDKFRIGFWSKSPSDRIFMVGLYEEAELSGIDKNSTLKRKLDTEYRNRGIYKRRAKEVLNLDLLYSDHMCLAGHRTGDKPPSKYTAKQIVDEIRSGILKGEYPIRCPVSRVRLFPQFVEITGKPAETLKRTRFYTPSQEVALDPQISAILYNPEDIQKRLSEEIVRRTLTAKDFEVEPKHNKLSNKFVTWLQSKGLTPHVERKPIDVDFFIGDLLIRAELKVVSSGGIRESIRQAIGQLLEYNYYFEEIPRAEKWLIVLDKPPVPHDVVYVETLSSRHDMPLSLMWTSKKGFESSTPDFLLL
jgi:hypothetical protein